MTGLENSYKIITGIITYNQEKFISRTIQSVLEQEISHTHHIVIFDDSSSDSTPQIIRSFKEKYPDRISIYLKDKNVSVGHIVDEFCALVKEKSKYLAIVEGDDYWNFPLKLKKQVDFLENNNEYNGCFHDSLICCFNEKENIPELARTQSYGSYKTYSQFNRYHPDFYAWDLFQRNLIPTSSLVFRNSDFKDFTSQFKNIKLSLNWAFHLFLLRKGKFRYFNETWSVYNDHPEGFSKKYEYNEFKTSNIRILKLMVKHKIYSCLDLNLNQAIASEYRQILYNPVTRKRSFLFYIITHIKYSFRTILVLKIEALYLVKSFFKKTK